MTANSNNFFVAGGTLPHDSPSYVQRPADAELYEAVLAGKFCYILTPRQMGKSSLMVRTTRRLETAGVRTAIIDLTQIGTGMTIEQWYLGLLMRLKNQLKLAVNPEAWWADNNNLGPVQRFSDFLHDILLSEIRTAVAIFIDEIDSTLSLDFTDDFFAAIRAFYNSRATEPAYERLTFVLLGVATPAELIKDRNRTPFNIGQRIDLREFRRADANVLQQGLQAALPDQQGQTAFDRIFYWTNGHPYFTQKLCLSILEKSANSWGDNEVDELVNKSFLSEGAKYETNLQFVRENVNVNSQKRQLLTLYRQVFQGKEVAEDERSLVQNHLKLYGLLQGEDGKLVIRNEIYRHAFNETWIKASMPADWTRRVAIIATLGVLLLLSAFVYYLQQQEQRATETLAQQVITTFENNPNPNLRLNSLNDLLNMEEYSDEARGLFLSLSPQEQLALFSSETADLPFQRLNLVKSISPMLDNTTANNTLLEAMQSALVKSGDADSQLLSEEIGYWLLGREAYAMHNYDEAMEAYEITLGLNQYSPAIYFDRGLTHLAQDNQELGLSDFNTALSLAGEEDIARFWREHITAAIVSNAQLHAVWWQQRESYASLVHIVPTPTLAP